MSQIQDQGLKWAIFFRANLSDELGPWGLGYGFRCFGCYLPGKLHALSSLSLARLSANMASCYCNTVREGFHRFFPPVNGGLGVETFNPTPASWAFPRQFQKPGTSATLPLQ